MLIITGTFRVSQPLSESARQAMNMMIAGSRSEQGCIRYSYATDMLDNGLVHVIECWSDRAALAQHFASAHIAAWRAAWPELGISDRALRLFECDEGEIV